MQLAHGQDGLAVALGVEGHGDAVPRGDVLADSFGRSGGRVMQRCWAARSTITSAALPLCCI
jgi:hypothetical protein